MVDNVEQALPSTTITHWAEIIHTRGLTDIAVPLLALLEVWGFVGGQLLWMLAPFLGEQAITPYALALEQPDILHQLQQQLIAEGA